MSPWTKPEIKFPATLEHPYLACNVKELDRLKIAYHSGEREHIPVSKKIKHADKALSHDVAYPPRGAQHNQWYQCEPCQLALETVYETHHKCPLCKTVYSGAPFDDVIFGRIHRKNFDNMLNAAWAYAITEDKKYAEYAAAILLKYSEFYEGFILHDASCREGAEAQISAAKMCEQTLDEAMLVSTMIAPGYDLIFSSGVLSAMEHIQIKSGLIEPMLETIDGFKAGKGNWQTWHNAAMLCGGAVLGNEKWMQKATADKENGFLFQMETSFSEEGMQYENSWGYHFYTLTALVLHMEGARHLGIDLWNQPNVKAPFTLPFSFILPDGSLPRFADTTGASPAESNTIEEAFHSLKDKTIEPYLSKEPSFKSIMYGRDTSKRAKMPNLQSEVFKGTGNAVLRINGDKDLVAAMTFSPNGGFHGHFDKLSFVLFAYGKELGVDRGRAQSQAYRLPIHKDWYRATVSHNTVMIDGKSQEACDGKLEWFESKSHDWLSNNGTVAAVLASNDDSYKKVTHKRLLVLFPEYALVFDELVSDTEKRFDWMYHNLGRDVNLLNEGKTEIENPENLQGFKYMQNVQTFSVSGQPRIRFNHEDISCYLLMAENLDTKVTVGTGAGKSVEHRIPFCMVTHQAKQTQFAGIMEPCKQGFDPLIGSVNLISKDGSTTITVNHDNGDKDLISLTKTNVCETSRNDNRLL